MGQNLTRKILADHLVSGELTPGGEIAIRVDQTLTQDATGTMTYLQFEAMDITRVRTKLSVSYVDHNMLQTGFEVVGADLAAQLGIDRLLSPERPLACGAP